MLTQAGAALRYRLSDVEIVVDLGYAFHRVISSSAILNLGVRVAEIKAPLLKSRRKRHDTIVYHKNRLRDKSFLLVFGRFFNFFAHG
jgi:hypothetical protein